eukprot:scaffold61357_cov75-Phaeocystis_antarctica.AAC.1
MSRNAPLAEEPIQQHVLTAIEMSRDESKTTIKYPKDCRGAVLMCAAQTTAASRVRAPAHCSSLACALHTLQPPCACAHCTLFLPCL